MKSKFVFMMAACTFVQCLIWPIASFSQTAFTPQSPRHTIESFLLGHAYVGIDEAGLPCDVNIYKNTFDGRAPDYENIWVVILGGNKRIDPFVFKYRHGLDPVSVSQTTQNQAMIRIQLSKKNYFEIALERLQNQTVSVQVTEKSGSIQSSKTCFVSGP